MSLVVLALFAVPAAALASLVVSSGGSGSSVALVAYSTPREAYAELIPSFQSDRGRRRRTVRRVLRLFRRAVPRRRGRLAGGRCRLLARARHDALVEAGLVAEDWNENEYDGFVTKSVVVFVIREGIPRTSRLGRPDPARRRGDRAEPVHLRRRQVDIMAAYGAQLKQGKSEDEAMAYLEDLFEHVPVRTRALARRCRRSSAARATS